MSRRWCLFAGLAVAAGAFAPAAAAAAGLAPATVAKAQAWIGRDASVLLLQLRVDGNRVQIEEDDATLETRYTWRTVTPAWVEKVHVSGGQFMYMESTGNGQRPVFAPIVYEERPHPELHRCDVTYIADSEGIVRRWEHRGPECDADIVGPDARRR